jgi:hypothetical protein
MASTYGEYLNKVTANVHKATFGSDKGTEADGTTWGSPGRAPRRPRNDPFKDGAYGSNFAAEISNSSLEDPNAPSTSTFEPTGGIVANTEGGYAGSATTTPAANTAPVNTGGAAAAGVMESAFGALGSLLGGGLGTIAQNNYTSLTNGSGASTPPPSPGMLPIEQNSQSGTSPEENTILTGPGGYSAQSTTNVVNPSAPTPAEAAHALGAAAANGVAKVVNGQAPPSTGKLDPLNEQARIVAHGLQGAPAEIKQAVAQLIPPAAQAGFLTGVNEMGSGGKILVGLLAVGVAMAAVHEWTKKKAGAR